MITIHPLITIIKMAYMEKDQDEWHNLTEQNNVVEGAAGYGLINQTDVDSSDSHPSYSIQVPVPEVSRHLNQENGKTNIIINLCIFGSITLIFTIIFVFTLSKKNTEDTSLDDQSIEETFLAENPPLANEIALLHTLEKGIHCPDYYSFSPVQLKCLKCQSSCKKCQPGIGGVIPCVKCAKAYYLMGDQCLKTCPHGFQGFEGLCLPDQEHFFRRGQFNLNDTVQAEIPYMLYQPRGIIRKVVFLVPPIGNNHLYFSVLTDLSRFAQDSAAVVMTIATPVEQVAKFVELKDDKSQLREEFPFISMIGKYILANIELENVDSYYYAGLSDSLFVAHQLSHYIIKQSTCHQCKHSLILLQTMNTRLATTLRHDQLELGIVLGYLDNQFEVKHQDSGAVSHSEDLNDTVHSDDNQNQVMTTIKAAQEFKNRFSLAALFKPAYNMDLEIFLINELGCETVNLLSDLKKNRPKSLELTDINLTEFEQDQQKKIQNLIGEGLLDLISSHGTVNERSNNELAQI